MLVGSRRRWRRCDPVHKLPHLLLKLFNLEWLLKKRNFDDGAASGRRKPAIQRFLESERHAHDITDHYFILRYEDYELTG